jgi:hypothetical protein
VASPRTRWGAQNVVQQKAGAKRLRHRIVGEMTVELDVYEPVAEPGMMLYTYRAQPGSPSGQPAAPRRLDVRQLRLPHSLSAIRGMK